MKYLLWLLPLQLGLALFLTVRVSQVAHKTVNSVINYCCSLTVIIFEHFCLKIKTKLKLQPICKLQKISDPVWMSIHLQWALLAEIIEDWCNTAWNVINSWMSNNISSLSVFKLKGSSLNHAKAIFWKQLPSVVFTAKKKKKLEKMFVHCDKIQNVMVEHWWKSKFFFSWLNIYVKYSTICVNELHGLPELLFPSGLSPEPTRCLPVPLRLNWIMLQHVQRPLAFIRKFINVRCQKICYLSQKMKFNEN